MGKSASFYALGTRCHIGLVAQNPEALVEQSREIIASYETIFSFHRPDSELNQLNQAAGQGDIPISAPLFELLDHGLRESLAQPSQLNIALGPLVKAWSIGLPTAQKPSPASIKHLLSLCRPEGLSLDHGRRRACLKEVGMALDLGALAKGYIADKLMAELVGAGASDVILDFGGNILVHGRECRVGIQNPFARRGQVIGHFPIKEAALVTSGTYERFFKHGDHFFHHILDRQTGYPVESPMVALSILAPTALQGETWSSRLFGLDLEQVLSLLNQTPDLEGLILTKDKKQYASDGWKSLFRPTY